MKYLRTSKDESSTSTWKAIVKCMTLVSIKPQGNQFVTEKSVDLGSEELLYTQGQFFHVLFPNVGISHGQPQPEYSQRVFLKRGGSSLTQTETPQEKKVRPSTWIQDLQQELNELSFPTPPVRRDTFASSQKCVDCVVRSLKASKSDNDEAQFGYDLRGYSASGEPCFEKDSFTPVCSVEDMRFEAIEMPTDPERLREYMIGLYHLLPPVLWQVRYGQDREKLEMACQNPTLQRLSLIRRHLRHAFDSRFRQCVRRVFKKHLDAKDPTTGNSKVEKVEQRAPSAAASPPGNRSLSHEDTFRIVNDQPHSDNEAEDMSQRGNDQAAYRASEGLSQKTSSASSPRLGDFSRFAARCLVILSGYWSPVGSKVAKYVERAADTFWPAGAYETECLHEALDLIDQRDSKTMWTKPYIYRLPASYLDASPWFLLLAMHAPKNPGEVQIPPNIQMIHLLAWIDNIWKVMKYVETGKRGALPPFPGEEMVRGIVGNSRKSMNESNLDQFAAALEKFYSDSLHAPVKDLMTYKIGVLKRFQHIEYLQRVTGGDSRLLLEPKINDSVFSAWWKFRTQLPKILSPDTRGFIALLVHYLDKKRGINEYSRYMGDFLAQVLTWWDHRSFSRSFNVIPEVTSFGAEPSVAFDDRIRMAQHFLHDFCEKYGISEALLEVSGQERHTLSDQFLEADIEFFKFLNCDARFSTSVEVRRGILQLCLTQATAIYEKRNALKASKLAQVSTAEEASPQI